MKTLQEQLQGIKAKTADMMTPEIEAAMKKGFEQLREKNVPDRALKVGDAAPAFSLPDAQGEMVDSRTLLKQGPLVVLFYRGKWWPYCNAELAALRESYADIQSAGGELVAISPQLQTYARELVKERRLPFPVLSDKGNSVADAFGVAFTLPDSMRWVYEEVFKFDLPTYNGDDSWRLPMPARFILDRNAVIQAADVNLDHTVRPEPASAIEALKRLQSWNNLLGKSGAAGNEAWLISGNPFDVIGAISAGMKGAWIKRSEEAVFDPWGVPPTITADNLLDLADKLAFNG